MPSKPLRIACDVHTHTLYSRHAYSTIGECVHAAAGAGLELLGSTDHFGAMLFTTNDARNFQHFINFGVWPRVWEGVVVMHGCEADIMDLEGHLFGWDVPVDRDITQRPRETTTTLKDFVFRGADYAIASIHNDAPMAGAPLAATTQMYLNVLEDPKVLILGHVGRAGVPFDLDEVLTAAKEKGKLIEINEHSLEGRHAEEAHGRCRAIAERCAELGVMVSTATDAHIYPSVGQFTRVRALLDEVHFPQELVATRDSRTFLGVVERAVGTRVEL
jgi:putative hydrolase